MTRGDPAAPVGHRARLNLAVVPGQLTLSEARPGSARSLAAKAVSALGSGRRSALRPGPQGRALAVPARSARFSFAVRSARSPKTGYEAGTDSGACIPPLLRRFLFRALTVPADTSSRLRAGLRGAYGALPYASRPAGREPPRSRLSGIASCAA